MQTINSHPFYFLCKLHAFLYQTVFVPYACGNFSRILASNLSKKPKIIRHNLAIPDYCFENFYYSVLPLSHR